MTERRHRFYGRAIGQRRTELGLSQLELAQRIGAADGGHISRLESGKYTPSITLLADLARALELAPAELLTRCLQERE